MFNRNGFVCTEKEELLNKYIIYCTFMCVDVVRTADTDEIIRHERIVLIKVNLNSILKYYCNSEISDILFNAVYYYWVFAAIIMK